MALTSFGGGLWVPSTFPGQFGVSSASAFPAFSDALLLDADQEESQMIGQVFMPGGPGTTKTFGTSGSKIDWNSGASITFAVVAILRVGVKKAASISTASGPPARATAGSAAYDVYTDLVAGVDAIASTSPITTTMASGTPFSVAHGDLIAVCHYLGITSGGQSIKVRGTTAEMDFPCSTLVTSTGGTFTRIATLPAAILTFDDGSIGWIMLSSSDYGLAAETIGNTNIYGNIFNMPFDCVIDAVSWHSTAIGGTTNYDVGIWTTPFGTPTAHGGNISADPQILGAGGNRISSSVLSSAYSYSANTDIMVGVKQNSATAISMKYLDNNGVDFFQPDGLNANYYAAKSTAGATAVAANSGKRRAHMWIHISQIQATAGGGSGSGPFSRIRSGM